MSGLKVGDRIRLTAMPNDPDPIPEGTTGTVFYIQSGPRGLTHVTVIWDNSVTPDGERRNRCLTLVVPPDEFTVIERR